MIGRIDGKIGSDFTQFAELISVDVAPKSEVLGARPHYFVFGDTAVFAFAVEPIFFIPAIVWHLSGNMKRVGS
jgi:hypothetical protein